MTVLVVIHPEMAETSLQDSLAHAVQKRLQKDLVYVLPSALDLGKYQRPFVYSRHKDVFTIESYLHLDPHYVVFYDGREYAGTSCFAPQFLALKKKLLADQQKEVDICGVAREVCIDDVFRLLTTLQSKPWVNYEAAAAYLGIEKKTLQLICNTHVSTHILDDLCDEPLSSQSDILL